MIHFDATRDLNRAPIRKLYEVSDSNLGIKAGGSDACSREFILHGVDGPERGLRGLASAADVEMMFLKTRKPAGQIKKKARIHYSGTTASVLYPEVKRPQPRDLPQVSIETKRSIFPSPECPLQNGDSLDKDKWATQVARKKSQVGKAARMALPLNWWERDPKIFKEVFDNFNVIGVIDLYGSPSMAIACVDSSPPLPYVGLVRNEAHEQAHALAVDQFIMKEMGREGPPASKFYLAEVKDLVQRLFPTRPEEADNDQDDDMDEDEGAEDE